MKRILAISDIHGCYNEFAQLLKVAKYDPETDKLVLLGDYVDRGAYSKKVVEQVMLLVQEHGVVALRGNHDQMFLDYLTHGTYDTVLDFINNGGYSTLESYTGESIFDFLVARQFILDNYKHHVDFLNSLPYFYETEDNIFVHAGVNPFDEDWKQTPPEEMIWIRDIFHNNPTGLDKIVVFGHTPTVNLHKKTDVWHGGDKIGVDGGCCFGLQLNCLIIEDGVYSSVYVDSSKRKKTFQ